jgi:hypothetical protein
VGKCKALPYQLVAGAERNLIALGIEHLARTFQHVAALVLKAFLITRIGPGSSAMPLVTWNEHAGPRAKRVLDASDADDALARQHIVDFGLRRPMGVKRVRLPRSDVGDAEYHTCDRFMSVSPRIIGRIHNTRGS